MSMYCLLKTILVQGEQRGNQGEAKECGEKTFKTTSKKLCAQTANRLTFCFCICILQAGAEDHSQGIKERNRDCVFCIQPGSPDIVWGMRSKNPSSKINRRTHSRLSRVRVRGGGSKPTRANQGRKRGPDGSLMQVCAKAQRRVTHHWKPTGKSSSSAAGQQVSPAGDGGEGASL